MAYRIVVDAGHGGDDPGAVSGNLREKDFNLEAANYMYERFQELGIPVVSTRTDDVTLTREQRLNTMRSLGTDSQVIILANHINSGGGEGAEVIYPLRSNDVLARNILEAIGEEGQPTRKYYQRRLPEDPSKDYYYIMRETPNTTALLIEYGFIDNPNDVRRLQNNLLDYVEAVVRAVANYTGTPYAPPGGTVQNTYTVQAGDSLYSIAQRFGTTVNELRTLNNLTSNTLRIGQVLRLPGGTSDEQVSTYTVQAGDSLYSIAQRFNTTVNELRTLNNLTSNTLQIGQVLRIPGGTTTPPPSGNQNIYTVQAGDSLYRIAQRFGITVGEIIDANNLTSTVLSVGQQLIIPSSGEDEEQETLTYTVTSGDSLYGIAQRFGVSVDDIIRTNNLSSTALQIGQVLRIPVTSTTLPDDEQNYTTYTVQRGDSLYSIAQRFNTNVDAIRNFNNLTSNTLQIGQVLRIPTTTGSSPSTISYTVKSGDSLWTIAREYNTTVQELRTLNNLTSDLLQIGQVLLVPVS